MCGSDDAVGNMLELNCQTTGGTTTFARFSPVDTKMTSMTIIKREGYEKDAKPCPLSDSYLGQEWIAKFSTNHNASKNTHHSRVYVKMTWSSS